MMHFLHHFCANSGSSFRKSCYAQASYEVILGAKGPESSSFLALETALESFSALEGSLVPS